MRTQQAFAASSLATLASLLLAGIALYPVTAAAISSRTLIAPTGPAGDKLGIAVASAGDVNGDGYADVIVGAYADNNFVGRAYVYYGGPGADAIPDLTLTGQAVDDGFGWSVSTAGDVNGDGYADVIVGALGNDAGGTNAGRAYVYYGGPGADATADLTLTGAAAGDDFGTTVSTAGDLNGDGYADVIVGAPGNDAGGTDAGRAYVYYGGPGADATADLTLTGAATGDNFGNSVSTAGDFNGDGYVDVIVGAPFNNAAAGRAYIYYGGPGVDATADVILSYPTFAGDEFGWSVSTAGDVNGDGIADVIVGARENDAGGSNAGRAYVYYGARYFFTGIPDLTFTGEALGDLFGSSVSTAGDVNGDGYADVIVGAWENGAGGTNAGRAYVYYGGPGADATADLTFTGAALQNEFGWSVSTAGDWNGDGYADVIVGAPRNQFGGGDAGRAYVLTSRPYDILSPNGGEQWVSGEPATVRWLGLDVADLWISYDGGASWSLLVSSVGGAEVNEFTLTAPGPATTLAKMRVSAAGTAVTNATSDMSNGVFRIVLPVVPPAAAARLQLTPTGEAALNFFGISVSSAGDVNGDGYSDVIVGAFGYNSYTGRAYVYFGGPSADNVPDLTLTGATVGDNFGNSVSSAGDVNGDGYGDVIVGAPGYSSGTGRAYVYYGGSGADNVPDLILTGAAAGNFFGVSVSSAGDVNGDGYGDVIVGANGYGGHTGRAYVYFGGPNANNVVDLTLTGEATNNEFGLSVSSVGDANGDGYADVIVGAYGYSTYTGRAYVYFGGPAADNVADLTLTGEAVGDNFGISVSSVGDVNGDGYADAIVGANGYGGKGRAYVYFGGPGADNLADLTLTGTAAGDDFGSSVSSAGDVNGDGYADVIVGATQSNAGGAGRAYVFYGGPGADNVADLILAGGAADDNFGVSVSSAGDVNRDGFGDVIVGAHDYSGATGRAYVYDINRYQLLSPIGGETWHVGATKSISWLGAEPADVWLSADGGNSYQLQLSRVGGVGANSVPLRVPHLPSKFARVRLTPSDASLKGQDQSDSSFTIQTSVALLALLAAPAPNRGPGALVTWSTDPGPADLEGYRLERASTGSGWATLVGVTRETSYADPSAGPATRYRLFAVNGFGEELLLGETSFRPAAPLVAWPLPYRDGNLSISFATASRLGGGPGPAEVLLFDASGRLVKTIARGSYAAGYQSAIWDGRDEQGKKVANGIYFLRSAGAGEEHSIKVVILR